MKVNAHPVASNPESAEPVVPRREHFIPLRKSELVAVLEAQPGLEVSDRAAFRQLCAVLESTIHFEYHDDLEALKDAYAPFNPDADTRPLQTLDEEQRRGLLPELFDRFIDLLTRANYHRLTLDEVRQAVGAASDWGVRLRVDFNMFERLEVFARGDEIGRRHRRRLENYYRLEEVEVPHYRRLIVIFYLRPHRWLEKGTDVERVYIKVFKNIPKLDMDMLLPGTRVRMSLVDRGRILLPTVSGLSLAIFKILKGAVVLALTSTFWGMLAFLGFVGGTVGYGIKSFFGYLQTKDKYQLNLTRSLYYQNLDNNAGVLFRVLDEAEEQEFREAIIAYYLLWRQADPAGLTRGELNDRAEQLLRRVANVDVDFETADAVAKLLRLGLATEDGSQRLHAVGIHTALANLDHAWDNFFNYHRLDDSAQDDPSDGPPPGFLKSRAS